MFAKSFIALDGNDRLIGAKTVQTAPYDRYTCHLCGSTLRYHPAYDSERPWFEHTHDTLKERPIALPLCESRSRRSEAD
ncbi:DNA polymerase III subunit alpha [Photorhabdus stackebrandtii]|uniref:DNA polymerase III subunit alpha n=1 Tax=Photorhabdus stackebrandtii TaxID=1123042 RepID=A0A7X5QIQ7_9GAMM|nr:DNA polymerase III subunit alpha [Photorhabdus stackebrandtii]